MPRPYRTQFKNAFYHVMSRGMEGKPIFVTDSDRLRFLKIMEDLSINHMIDIFAYCLMDNHYHLMIRTPKGNLSDAMHFLNTSYAAYFNKTRDRKGHLFASRFKSILMERNSYSVVLSRYIHLNPVVSNLVKKPEYYRWSSYREYLAMRKTSWIKSEWILSHFSEDLPAARIYYKDFVNKQLTSDINSSPIQLVNVLDIIQVVKNNSSLNTKTLRKVALLLSYRHSGLSYQDIGKYFGNLSRAGVRQNINRFLGRLEKNSKLREIISAIEKEVLIGNEKEKPFTKGPDPDVNGF